MKQLPLLSGGIEALVRSGECRHSCRLSHAANG